MSSLGERKSFSGDLQSKIAILRIKNDEDGRSRCAAGLAVVGPSRGEELLTTNNTNLTNQEA